MSDKLSEEDLLSLIKKLDQLKPENDSETGKRIEPETKSESDDFIAVTNNHIQIHATQEYVLTIEAAAPVQLFRNGKRLLDKTMVGQGDKIEWKIEHAPLYQIEISPDNMSAYLVLLAKERFGWKLVDKPPGKHVVVEAVEDRAVVIENIRLSDIMLELQRRKITKNVKAPAVFKELQSPTYGQILIANGIEPVPSVDARLELYFSETIQSELQESDGSVDFRNHLKIPMAKKGDIIAKKYPPVPGSIGYDVYGELIKPAPPKDFAIVAKENTDITPGGEVIALMNGRPRVTGAKVKYFDITTAHVISGDVDMKTGNIVFSGDVIVYGDVMEGMIIESLGNVYVTGNVYQSTITATGSICIKGNIVGSKLYSGYFGVIFNRLYLFTKKMAELLQQLLDAAKVLIQVIEARGKTLPYKQIIITLVESKFQEIPKTARDIIQTIHSIQSIVTGEMSELKEKLQLFTHPESIMTIGSPNEIVSAARTITETFEMIERMQENDSVIDIWKCHLTEIKSNGSSFVRGEGVLQCSIYAKGDILFLNKDSVCRGGSLECGGMISAYKIGGEIGNDTLLKAGKKIVLQRMTSGRLCIGKFSKDVLEPIEHIVASVQNNRLVLAHHDSDGG